MEVSSSRQVYVFLLCVLSGLMCGAFFDLQRFLREKHKAGKTRTLMEDMLFTLVCIATIIGFGYFFNNGELRYFQLMGTLSGVLFYASLLSNVFRKLLNVLFSLFIHIILNPIKKIFCLVMIPIKAILEKLKKLKNRKNKLIKSFSRHFAKKEKNY